VDNDLKCGTYLVEDEIAGVEVILNGDSERPRD
jgi:hypothetical protein